MGMLTRNVGISPATQDALALLEANGSLPFIRGRWYFIDPKSGADTGSGDIDSPVKNLRAAYKLCIDSAGDGICFLSRSSATTADTTSYLGGTLVWAKYGITVVGICAGQGFNNRARISTIDRAYVASAAQFKWTTAGVVTDTLSGFLTEGFEVGDAVLVSATAGASISTINVVAAVAAGTLTLTDTVTANLTPGIATMSTHARPPIKVTGKNNRFVNMGFVQSGTVATDDGAVWVAADDNRFDNCFFNGVTNAANVGAEDTCHDLTLSASECAFNNCVFGSNSTIRASSSGHVVLGNSTTQIGQNFFTDCKVISYSATAGHGAIKIADVATLGGWVQFDNCTFVNWDSGALTALTAAIMGANPTNLGILIHRCGMVGWAIWQDAAYDATYTTAPASAGEGGRAVVTA